jgi:hypothetical protein
VITLAVTFSVEVVEIYQGGSNGILYRFSTSKVVEAMEIGRVEEVENTINVLVAQTGRLGRQPGILLQACAITEV